MAVKIGKVDKQNGLVICMVCGESVNRSRVVRARNTKHVELYSSTMRRVKNDKMDGYVHEECLAKCRK